ncbi:uncharacterized protein Dana_GF10629, isoform B [Drosophila ananassae]|uniref:Uncharacterized protein, isoform B n=2 Tax=Drosophila ananassae TaxID=7217 RepID=B3M5P0_DROAN|nr:uncharacterized protein LOC6493497 isoform X1 [Drosophila ananassae]EDV40674.2 uncharacterized protein Dana_GF10629, isoform C [Drosophila ananassae]KPU78686.1 uncharacterized protein Dana_GF10629, isoform B [Drosophila ananassae]
MSSLRICQAMSLNPIASGQDSVLVSAPRTCLMGCQDVKPNELRRFPVQDPDRCKHWLQHFNVSDKLVEKLGGLQKLRICFRHFSQRQAMAKTRIKMTPLRKSSKALLPTSNGAAGGGGGGEVTGGVNGVAKTVVDGTTIELVKTASRDQVKKTITLSLPQRSHSICSSASSDVQSISSDYEVSLPLSTLEDAQNGSNRLENGQPKKRKLYLITEKSDESSNHAPETNGQAKKRKMFVVVEQERESEAKKLMIVADKSQANLTKHLEKLLPEILHRIQDKEQKPIKPTPPAASKLTLNRPHITLPPKKNPTNFVKIASNPGPTPTSPIQMPLPIQNTKVEKTEKEDEVQINSEETETNINLSPDFRFLMKILPKLEQLPEPHKQNVKRSIQIFIEKSYSIYGKKD